MVRADMESEEFKKTFNKSHIVYQKYQMAIHNDSPDKCTAKQGNYYPSYLVCPETYNWVPIEECRPKLDLKKYSRLDEKSAIPSSTDINTVLVLHERQIMPYQVTR
ncbi:hypothetical protein QZH41_019877 [Actinostola sp. cb2023]|nr:hypothetical protein QZH41_019877 [Actinostola sp. cb2023]